MLSLIGGAAYISYDSTRAPMSLTVAVKVDIQRGSSLSSIADMLEAKGVIRWNLAFKATAYLLGIQEDLKSGQYEIPAFSSTFDVLSILKKGAAVLQKVTIPEGLTVQEVADILEEQGYADAAIFVQFADSYEVFPGITGAQGFLFPDTYVFSEGFTEEMLVKLMVDNFFERLLAAYPDYKSMSAKELYDKVVLASIVEREYRVPEETPLMASVFYNRIAKGIRLESCATVAYAITHEYGRPYPRRLYYADLEIKSAYNTYRNLGLPPAPIANPGYHALYGTFNPADTDYLFFVLKDRDAGQHYFSETLAEHEQAARLFLK